MDFGLAADCQEDELVQGDCVTCCYAAPEVIKVERYTHTMGALVVAIYGKYNKIYKKTAHSLIRFQLEI